MIALPGWLTRARRVLHGARVFLAALEEHAVFSHGAATAFFLFFSIPPAVLALVALIGLVPLEELTQLTGNQVLDWIRARVRGNLPPDTGAVAMRLIENALAPYLQRLEELGDVDLLAQVQALLDRTLPKNAAGAIGQLAADVLERPRPGLLTVGSIAIVWSASGATRAAMRAMNAIYEVRRQGFFRRAAVSVGLTLAILLGASFTVTALPLGNRVAQAVVEALELPGYVLATWAALNWVVGLAFMLGVVCVLLRYGPNARHGLRLVTPGALLTVLLWIVLGLGLRTWTELGWERTNATYGTLAAVIVLLLWCYLVSVALLLGAEVNAFVVQGRGLAAWVVGGLALPHARRWPPLTSGASLPPVRGRRRRRRRRASQRAVKGPPGEGTDREREASPSPRPEP